MTRHPLPILGIALGIVGLAYDFAADVVRHRHGAALSRLTAERDAAREEARLLRDAHAIDDLIAQRDGALYRARMIAEAAAAATNACRQANDERDAAVDRLAEAWAETERVTGQLNAALRLLAPVQEAALRYAAPGVSLGPEPVLRAALATITAAPLPETARCALCEASPADARLVAIHPRGCYRCDDGAACVVRQQQRAARVCHHCGAIASDAVVLFAARLTRGALECKDEAACAGRQRAAT